MSDDNEQRGGFGRGRGRGRRGDRGDRGRGGERGDRGGERRGGRGRGGDDDKEWVPVTKLGRLVKARLIKSIEEIYLFSIPIKEYQIMDYFFPGDKLKEEVMKVMPVQKQTKAGQRTRFKAFIALGDMDGHVGLGTKCASELAIAIRGAIIASKLSVRPVRRGYWGNKVGLPHTVPCKVTGKCGSVRMRLIPAPRGTGLVAAVASKKMLSMAGIHDVYTSANGHTRTMGNFIQATFNALQNTYGYLSPELWGPTHFFATPFQEQSDFLAQDGSKAQKRANYED